ncbi:hypothetical protein PsorP6_012251 [Peronosclerospora sorghi]|uniref:Uncharacterized protein n=1 Tax=Peronosclerospora sorghi TaxID=230839 RepID=A0ACC0WHX4_9STRA|nr:hypothetical protein PsorP6_012251 [Peronosclerospora sorghi]
MTRKAEILHQLLIRQVNVDHQDENGWTALHHACFVQSEMAIKMLIHAGVRPMRESYGLLPQDLLRRGHKSEWVAQAQNFKKDSLDQITPKSNSAIKLLAFRPSGIVQLDMDGQVEKGSFVTLEVESVSEFEFVDQPLIVLKRIGIVVVDDIRVDAIEFADANYSVCGDFIPEKILGVGVVGKYAYLSPIGEEHQLEDVEHTYESWVRDCSSGSDEMDDIGGIDKDETSASRFD